MKIKSTLLVASALLGMTSAVSLGQTNVPTNETSYISGRITIPAPKVRKGADAASSSFERSVTIATTIRQVVDSTYKTNTKTGIITYKDAFKVYAFGNKELLQLGLGTNNVGGYSLVATNRFQQFSFSQLGFAAKKGTNFTTVSGISAGWNDGLYTSDTAENSNGDYLKENYAGFAQLIGGLGPFTGLSAIGSYKESLAKVVFGTGTNKTTNTYYSTSVSGSISQFWSPPQP
jgi:hypothetical protein